MIILSIFLLFFSNPFADKKPDYIKLSHKISDPFVIETKKKRGLSCVGHGGALSSNVKQIVLTFYDPKPATISEARRIFVEMSEDLIARYNSNEPIRPYMDNYPFTLKNIEILILFADCIYSPDETYVSAVKYC